MEVPLPPSDPSQLPTWALGVAVLLLIVLWRRSENLRGRLDAQITAERDAARVREEAAEAKVEAAEAERDKARAELREAEVAAERRIAEIWREAAEDKVRMAEKHIEGLRAQTEGYRRATGEVAAAVTAAKARIEANR